MWCTVDFNACVFSVQRKCDQYWPEDGIETYGPIQVKHVNTFSRAHYTVRIFSLKNVKLKKVSRDSKWLHSCIALRKKVLFTNVLLTDVIFYLHVYSLLIVINECFYCFETNLIPKSAPYLFSKQNKNLSCWYSLINCLSLEWTT